MINRADLVILCLPDDAAREAVGLVENKAVRMIDASTAHRTLSDWTYGFPEMTTSQRDVIANARFVANPGCYPTGFIALVRPVVEANLVPRRWPVSVNAMSGYTGGGRRMIAEFEDEDSNEFTRVPFRIYDLSCMHCAGNEGTCGTGSSPAVCSVRRPVRPGHDRGSGPPASFAAVQATARRHPCRPGRCL